MRFRFFKHSIEQAGLAVAITMFAEGTEHAFHIIKRNIHKAMRPGSPSLEIDNKPVEPEVNSAPKPGK